MTVVMARSYSRISGHTSDEVMTKASSGSAARQAAATTSSWAGWA